MLVKEVGLLGTLCWAGIAVLGGQDRSNVIRNPFSAADDVAAGEQSFRSQCAACHGFDASGAAGPSLTTGVSRHGNSDEALFAVITKGVPGTPMVGFKLEGREVWQLISFLRSANIAKGAGQAGRAEIVGWQIDQLTGEPNGLRIGLDARTVRPFGQNELAKLPGFRGQIAPE